MAFKIQVNDSRNGGYKPYGNKPHKYGDKPKCLPSNRKEALKDLHISRAHKSGRDESPVFLLYLNYAVNNLSDITGLGNDIPHESKIASELRKKGDEAIRKWANFLWLFRSEEPKEEYAKTKEMAIAIAVKFVALRNFFAHPQGTDIEPLLADKDFYRFVAGKLGGDALLETEKICGIKTDKLAKMKLMAKHGDDRYEFTRKGIIFLICTALYRSDAWEFTQCLEDMKLPTTSRKLEYLESIGEKEYVAVPQSKAGAARASVEFFTYFSTRQGRSVDHFSADDLNYLAFADLCGYLNKVPDVSMSYLTLLNERKRLEELKAESTESDENKETKYRLQRRFRDRFLQLSAAYCEDFNVLPSLRFKRLDLTETEGRNQYVFGKENDQRVRQDRHFIIKNNAIRFEFVPEKHEFGPIHIGALRSQLSADMMKRFLFADLNKEKNLDRDIKEYFSAYHRILERAINADDPSQLASDMELWNDLSIVTGYPFYELVENIDLLKPYFSENFIKYLIDNPELPGVGELDERLQNRLATLSNKATDFLTRVRKLEDWMRQLRIAREKDEKAIVTRPVCSAKDVPNPPRDCRFSDGDYVAWVMRWLNLNLADGEKFRQLPVSKEHRGCLDHEYQIVHALIGKVAWDPKGFELYIAKRRPALRSAYYKLKNKIKDIKKKEKEEGILIIRKDKNGKTLPDPLLMWTKAAAECCREEYNYACDHRPTRLDALRAKCKKYGVKTGLEVSKESLAKIVLRLDVDQWAHAFDNETQKNYDNRSLETCSHVVSQIPFPANFADRVLVKSKNPNLNCFVRKSDGKPDAFDFNAAFCTWEPSITGRDFYDVTPLVEAFKVIKKGGKDVPVTGIPGFKQVLSADDGDDLWLEHDTSFVAIDKAIRKIKDVANQDKILLEVASKYWHNFSESGTIRVKNGKREFAEKPVISDFFGTSVTLPFNGKKIVLAPNEIGRPILSLLFKYANELIAEADPFGESDEYQFHDLEECYRRLLAKARRERLELVPLLQKFESMITATCVYDGKTKEEKRKMEFDLYHRHHPRLTFDEYNSIADLRNAVYHRGLVLKGVAEVKALLGKYIG